MDMIAGAVAFFAVFMLFGLAAAILGGDWWAQRSPRRRSRDDR